MTVADLKYSDIIALANLLDGKDHDWCEFGIQLLPEIEKSEIQFLENGYTEEYCLSLLFIESLSSRINVITILDFIEVGRKFHRNDVVMFLQRLNFPDNLPIWELSWENLRGLYKLLERRMQNDWRMFADEFGFSNCEITGIERKRPRYESPTVLLFKMMRVVKPELKIEEMIPVCVNIRRSDVVTLLKSIMNRMNSIVI